MPKINKKMLLAAWSCNNKFWVIHQAYHVPLREMFQDVVNFDPQEESYKHGKEIMNRKFIELLKSYKPDYIMLFLVLDEFYPETLAKIKEILPHVKVVQWNGDDDIKFDNYTVPYSAIIDYQFISQLQFTKRYDEYKLPWFDTLGADIEKFRHLKLKKKYQVAFVGTPKGERLECMRYLLKKKVDFVLAGAGWKDYPEFKERYLGQISDEEFVKLINETKINICFSKNYFNSPHVLERSLQVNACKSFALTGYVDGYFPKFKEKVDFATFKDKEELFEKIQYYLKNEDERENIAQNAYKKVTSLYSNQKMLRDAFIAIERQKRELNGIRSRRSSEVKPLYLEFQDFEKGKAHIIEKVSNSKSQYICFKSKGYEILPYRDYFQAYSMDLLGKPVSICDAYLSSRIIGDYAWLGLYYAYHYYKDKSYFYDNIDISQFMVRKDYFVENFDKFLSIYQGKQASFVTEDNTSLLTMPLVRTRKIKRIPIRDIEHILFLLLELDLVVLRNKKKLFTDLYLYKLIFYSIFVNQQIMKNILVNLLRKTKNSRLIKLSNFFGKIF